MPSWIRIGPSNSLPVYIQLPRKTLRQARTEVYSPEEDSRFVDGPLELSFGFSHTVQVTDAHAGLSVLSSRIHADPDNPSVPSKLRHLVEASAAIGEICLEVELLLESTGGLYGNSRITSGLLFRFSSITIGTENFESLQGTSRRSKTVMNPEWSEHPRLSFSSGRLIG